MLQEFKNFIARGNVLDLAVGIIIGAAFTTIVNSLVNDMLMPPIGMLMGGIDFSNYFLNLGSVEYASLKAAKDAGAPIIAYGAFINTIINFLIVAGAVFLIVRQANKIVKKADATPAAPTPSEVLLTEIRDLLKK